MKTGIRIDTFHLENNHLDIEISGEIEECPVGSKLRIIIVFEQEHGDRRIPLFIRHKYIEGSQKCKFKGYTSLDLTNIFYQQKKFDQCKVSFSLYYGLSNITPASVKNGPGCRARLEHNRIMISYHYFDRRTEEIRHYLHRIYQIIGIPVGILLLPLCALEGLVAEFGLGTLLPVENPGKGLYGIVKHCNARFKKISGISLSPREIKSKFFRFYYENFRKLPIKEHQILFLSERAVSKNENAARIKRELSKYEDLELVEYRNTKTVNQLSRSELKEIARLIAISKVVVLDDFYPQIHWLNLRKETRLVQLWHACGAFKTFGFSRYGKKGGPNQNSRNHRSYDYAFVSSSGICDLYSEGFGIPADHVLPLGVPRTDFLFQEDYRQDTSKMLYEKYPMLENKKVVLIVPTFRGNGNRAAYYPVDKINLDEWCKQLPDDYVFVLKNHPFVKDKFPYSDKNSGRVLDLSGVEDINDLLLITNILITDYSSVVFEASMLNIPMLFYVFDLEEYVADRDFYYDFKQFVPGKILYEEQEVLDTIINEDFEAEKLGQFKELFMNAIDGHSTERIGNFIHELVEKTQG